MDQLGPYVNPFPSSLDLLLAECPGHNIPDLLFIKPGLLFQSGYVHPLLGPSNDVENFIRVSQFLGLLGRGFSSRLLSFLRVSIFFVSGAGA